jgi:gamma-glutamyl:cysteine ligase YbdK (ATP-grasp superfamily)
MELFRFSTQRHMKRRYEARSDFAQYIGARIHKRHLQQTHVRYMRDAIELAEKDEKAFQELFREPMPEHLQDILAYEQSHWTALRKGFEAITTAWSTDDDYTLKTKALRVHCNAIIQALDLERACLYSPLSKTFKEQLNRLRSLQKAA